TGRTRVNRYAIAVALAVCGGSAAHAADAVIIPAPQPAAPVPERPGWAFQVTPYMWATGIDGHISPFRRLPTIGVHKSFSDVVEDLDFGGFANIWGRYERFVVSADIMYVSTSDSHTFGSLPPLPPPLPQIPAVTASVD